MGPGTTAHEVDALSAHTLELGACHRLCPTPSDSADLILPLRPARARAASPAHLPASPSPSGLQEPTLLPLLSYLLRLHHAFRASVPGSQLPEQELVDRLLPPLRSRDAAPLPSDSSSGLNGAGAASSGPVREADVQALIQCAGSSRRDAIEALKRHATAASAGSDGGGSSWDLRGAFSAELGRLRLDRALVGSLLADYVAFRGLEADIVRGAAAGATGEGGTDAGDGGTVSMEEEECGASCGPVQQQWRQGSGGHGGGGSWLWDDWPRRAERDDSPGSSSASLGEASQVR